MRAIFKGGFDKGDRLFGLHENRTAEKRRCVLIKNLEVRNNKNGTEPRSNVTQMQIFKVFVMPLIVYSYDLSRNNVNFI